jgi:hypothetical protein
MSLVMQYVDRESIPTHVLSLSYSVVHGIQLGLNKQSLPVVPVSYMVLVVLLVPVPVPWALILAIAGFLPSDACSPSDTRSLMSFLNCEFRTGHDRVSVNLAFGGVGPFEKRAVLNLGAGPLFRERE